VKPEQFTVVVREKLRRRYAFFAAVNPVGLERMHWYDERREDQSGRGIDPLIVYGQLGVKGAPGFQDASRHWAAERRSSKAEGRRRREAARFRPYPVADTTNFEVGQTHVLDASRYMAGGRSGVLEVTAIDHAAGTITVGPRTRRRR